MTIKKITKIPNWIDGKEVPPVSCAWIEKFEPHSGALCSLFADSKKNDVNYAVDVAQSRFRDWSGITPVGRGQILSQIAVQMRSQLEILSTCVAQETGKPPQDALSEVRAAILQAEYFAGEGMRLYGRSLTSGIPSKYTHTVRQPRGVAALIVPANTPIANIAWKVFPALICGNTVILKASEDAPQVANLFAKLCQKAGLPDGVLNVIHGRGDIVGVALVEEPRISVISFTGSTKAGRSIAELAGKRLARVSLELGGKNPFVVCDDADIEKAVYWATLSAFSNAGQRCAAGSRVLIFKSIYEEFRTKFVERARALRLGVDAGCDLGPVINLQQKNAILSAIDRASSDGAKLLCGGATDNPSLANGYYISPTIIDNVPKNSWINQIELFGPVVTIQPVEDILEALEFSNSCEYGLTAAIHTKNVDRAMWFAQHVKAGVANVNLGTFGSEPHMPFGGFGSSGNGTREPGVEALDIYSELKSISFLVSEESI
jgi:aldehyde dehydrogenase (NAD+)